MKIIIASDHGGAELKEQLKKYLEEREHDVNDIGTHGDAAVDYPDIGEQACREFLNDGGYDFGILLCGTGIGISIAANRNRKIRCALPMNNVAAALAREHNNANFIAFGGRVGYQESPETMLQTFLETEFSGDPRHKRRINKMS